MLELKSIPPKNPSNEYICKMNTFKGLNYADDEVIMSIEESPDCENFRVEGGRLKRVKGFGGTTWKIDGQDVLLRQLPDPVEKLFEFQSSDCTNRGYKNFYYSTIAGDLYGFFYDSEINKVDAELVPCTSGYSGHNYTYFTQYKDGTNNCALLGGPKCGPYVFTEGGGYSLISCSNKPHMKKTTMHYGRMFGIGDPNYLQRIWYSALNDPADFTISESAGGYIDIPDMIGNAIDIISYFDVLYVFCRYGIVALNSLSIQSNFSLENIYYSNSEIIPGSICVCGNKIFFSTRFGVYYLNGSNVKCISNSIKGFFEKYTLLCVEENSVYFKNQYFLSFHRNNEDTPTGLLIYDLSTGKWQIFAGTQVSDFCIIRDNDEEKLLAAQGDSTVVPQWGTGDRLTNSGAIYGYWKSPKNDWGLPTMIKHLKEAHFTASGTGKIYFIVCCDGKTKRTEIQLETTDKLIRLPLEISGNLVSFEIQNRGGCNISIGPVAFTYTIERERVN